MRHRCEKDANRARACRRRGRRDAASLAEIPQTRVRRARAVPAAANPTREHRSLARGGKRQRDVLLRGAAQFRSRTVVLGPNERLPAALGLEVIMTESEKTRGFPRPKTHDFRLDSGDFAETSGETGFRPRGRRPFFQAKFHPKSGRN